MTPKYNKNSKKKTKVQAFAPSVIPGQLTINSTPEGAEVRIDGRSDPSWVTPFNLPGLAPGQHSVTVSRAGYAPETRTIDVASGSKSFLVIQLAQLTAAAAITSQPAGAQIFLDGKDTGKVTPAQITVDKPGAHTFLIRKQGYLDETSSASLQAGQIFHFAPTLKALGSADDIKLGGKFKKLFGGGDTAGMGAVKRQDPAQGRAGRGQQPHSRQVFSRRLLSQPGNLRDRHHAVGIQAGPSRRRGAERAARWRSMRIWSGSRDKRPGI